MMYIYIVFIILFLLFDLIIYNITSNSMYKNIDEQLVSEVNKYNRNTNFSPSSTNNPNKKVIQYGSNTNYQSDNLVVERRFPKIQEVNPRFICIVRNEQGEVINQTSIGRIYEEYLTNMQFDENNIENTYMLKLANDYNYRGITIMNYNENGELNYIQFLANVDGEIESLKNISYILIVGTIVIIVISVIASYVLSRRALNPIIESWKKQIEFVQNASHELRTPLTIIQTKQELLLQEPNETIINKSEDINVSLNETKRLSKLIKDLMILAKSDSNEVILDKKAINIDDLIRKILTPYIEFAYIESKIVEMDLNYKKLLIVDESKISQLIVILLDNAIKYTTKGDKILIKTYDRDGKFFLEIIDTGIGISKEGIKHAFDRFYREDKARSRKTGGSGLGLAIAYMIVQLHSGNIKIMQNEVKGTKVIVKLA